MRPMSRHFGEIHGIDVSDEMIVQAFEKLLYPPGARARRQRQRSRAIPCRPLRFYLLLRGVAAHSQRRCCLFLPRETIRVLKPGGFARLQINGLPKTACAYTTWEGVRIGAAEIHRLTRDHGVRLLSLTGVDTQYMWTYGRSRHCPNRPRSLQHCRIRHVVNAFSGEQAVPSTGRLACATLQIENLPPACDLNSLEAFVEDVPGVGCTSDRP